MRGPSGEVLSTRLTNSRSGIEKLREWLAQNAVGGNSVRHACVAMSSFAGATAYSSPVFEFAYDATANTFVWGPVQMQQLAALEKKLGTSMASAMLPLCIAEHARKK